MNARPRRFQEAKQRWEAERNQAEQNFERYKLVMELENRKQKEETDRQMSEIKKSV